MGDLFETNIERDTDIFTPPSEIKSSLPSKDHTSDFDIGECFCSALNKKI